ncbi:TonB-dependent receptor plug domain-containing protein [Chitinophaga pendula]|uniref:TonB-dependent receptor n=1 Tax=Chitinophaga TaxID=79328 RepID=UPI000BB067D6|nr:MULTISPECIES: TonB-dependent receptor [Chitinophaga]ASZ13107.1 TonB-dependent receptor [Chitinophaga sp. MD30]UCJ09270.1 TonB-dependent receptor plug domain-containing protein [Chitinophaga pendula]
MIQRYKLLLLIAIAVTAHLHTCAQYILKGIIRHKDTNLPLEDANIASRQGTHAHSNRAGTFTLRLQQLPDTLLISHIGFEPQQIAVNTAGQTLAISLAPAAVRLDQVTVSSGAPVWNQVAKIDLQMTPVRSAQDLLRKVPGLFIAQHAGGGKAEQIFLRGFDVDHGTDVTITADGLPVNMPSHAHGQGYADLHFLIPETIRDIDFGKGAYYANKGDFNTAGYVNFSTFDRLDHSLIKLEGGQFNTKRMVALIDLTGQQTSAAKSNGYIAGEYYLTDGPFDHPQHFNRLNFMGKYNTWLNEHSYLSLQASTFSSKWDASGQIPLRAVNEGKISRFGTIDPTEGGNTSRTNLAANYYRIIDEHSSLKSLFYFVRYDFSLFSNFTFFLNDPVNGDEIHQAEGRSIYGFDHQYSHQQTLGKGSLNWLAGLGFRYDDINDLQLSQVYQRDSLLNRKAWGNVDEHNLYAYLNAEWKTGKFTLNPALRVNHFIFNYDDKLLPGYQLQAARKTNVSPKLNMAYQLTPSWQLYLKTGMGFHSNDARVVLAQQGKHILPRSYGADLGAVIRPIPGLILQPALWYLFLEQEFVYVGDEAVVEPSGKSRRLGADLGIRYQPLSWLYLDIDVNYANARFTSAPKGEQYVPLAPVLTSTGGIAVKLPIGLSANLRYRYIKDRPANEDNTATAQGYFINDLAISYSRKKWEIGLQVENLFNIKWREAQFYSESRLKDEPDPVSEIHFTPGTPTWARAHIAFRF